MNIYSGQYIRISSSLDHTVLAADQISAGRITDHTNTLKITSKTRLLQFVSMQLSCQARIMKEFFVKMILRCFFDVSWQFQSKMSNEWH